MLSHEVTSEPTKKQMTKDKGQRTKDKGQKVDLSFRRIEGIRTLDLDSEVPTFQAKSLNG